MQGVMHVSAHHKTLYSGLPMSVVGLVRVSKGMHKCRMLKDAGGWGALSSLPNWEIGPAGWSGKEQGHQPHLGMVVPSRALHHDHLMVGCNDVRPYHKMGWRMPNMYGMTSVF